MFKKIVDVAVTFVVTTLGQTVGEALYKGACIAYDNYKDNLFKGQK